ncbi:hypothetical protein BpHYR1_020978 [Brachionus plicatilis]|uniref:Uncharacterized protein n=1 Tax=Brachionus plicatilis TaxID=10195 RepID=A0A3M7P4S8_BRAPC|nr:hypothetical protein BpHYR1_020978 [Brachionus plicatilis]
MVDAPHPNLLNRLINLKNKNKSNYSGSNKNVTLTDRPTDRPSTDQNGDWCRPANGNRPSEQR